MARHPLSSGGPPGRNVQTGCPSRLNGGMSTKTDPRSGNYVSPARYSRHDLLLAAMPAALVAGISVALTTPLSFTVGLWAGCLLALPLLVYAVFIDPPIEG